MGQTEGLPDLCDEGLWGPTRVGGRIWRKVDPVDSLHLPWGKTSGGTRALASRDTVPRHLARMAVQKEGLPYLVWFEDRKAALLQNISSPLVPVPDISPNSPHLAGRLDPQFPQRGQDYVVSKEHSSMVPAWTYES